MFERFISLWKLEDTEIETFANVWGPLRITPAGDQIVTPTVFVMGRDNPGLRRLEVGKESLRAWRFFSRRAYSVLKLAASLQDGKPGSEEDWLTVSGPPEQEVIADKKAYFGMPIWSRREMELTSDGWVMGRAFGINRLRDQIAAELSKWAKRYRVNLSVVWNANPQMEITYEGQLLAAVALQMILTVLQERNMYTCSGCGLLYRRTKKRPKSGLANFCDKCGRNSAVAQADARRRERKEKAKALHRSGKSKIEIAAELDTTLETVLNWLKGESNV